MPTRLLMGVLTGVLLGLVISDPRPAYSQTQTYKIDTLRDKHGIRRGTVEERPNGEIVIKDNWGVRQGTIDRSRGETIVRNRHGQNDPKVIKRLLEDSDDE